jgi:hypothetical protein
LLEPSAEAEAPEPSSIAEAAQQAWDAWKRAELPAGKKTQEQRARFVTCVEKALEACPAAFRGTALDPEDSRRKREALCERVEALASRADTGVSRDASLEEMVAQLRRAFDANALRDRATDAAAAGRAALEEFRGARAAWERLGPVPGEAGKGLEERFRQACQRFDARRHDSA